MSRKQLRELVAQAYHEANCGEPVSCDHGHQPYSCPGTIEERQLAAILDALDEAGLVS